MKEKDELELRQKEKLKDFVETELLKNLSKRKLAIALDLTESAISLWVNVDSKLKVRNLPLSTILGFCEVSGLSIDEVARRLELFPSDLEYKSLRAEYKQKRFRQLIKDLLVGNTQGEVSRIFGVADTTVGKWAGGSGINPENVPASTLATIAAIKDYTIEELMVWLGIKKEKIPLASYSQAQEVVESLSREEQGQLLAWLAQRLSSGSD